LIFLYDFVKSHLYRHPGESRGPALLKSTGFQVKPGMTKEANYDFYAAINVDALALKK
jgi:hypothetical protein